MPSRWLALTAPLLVLAGCSRSQPDVETAEPPSTPAPAAPVAAPSAPPAAAPVVAPTEEQCEALAREVEAAAREGKAEGLRPLIDGEAVLERASPAGDARQAIREKSQASGGLAALIASRAAAGGSYRFVRLKRADDGWRLLFRVTALNGGVNYHELIPRRRPDGEARVVDARVYSSGEAYSATLRREALPALAKLADAGLTARESELLRHQADLAAIRTALNAGDGKAALRKIDSLPETLQNDRGVLLARWQAAQLVGGGQAREALAALQRQFPGDPCVDLAQVEAAMDQGGPSELIAAVDRLDRAVGGDAYLDTIRANAHLAAGNVEEARRAAERVSEKLPDLPTTYLLWLAVSLVEKNHAETARWLMVLRDRAGVNLGAIEANSAYAEFVKSPEYRLWAAKKR